jgi:hypothetical protein
MNRKNRFLRHGRNEKYVIENDSIFIINIKMDENLKVATWNLIISHLEMRLGFCSSVIWKGDF